MTTADDAALVRGHGLLADLDDDVAAGVADCVDVVRLSAGETLVTAGDTDHPLVLVLRGTVRVERDGDEVAVLGSDAWVGGLGLLDEAPATADVVADTDVVLGVVPRDRARRVLEVDAVALRLGSVAARRRATNLAVDATPVVVTTHTGTSVELRPVWPSDWRTLAAGERPVSERSLRMRFFNPPPLTERTFRRLTTLDLSNQFAWAALVDGELAGIGRYGLLVEDRGVAEVAVLVADDVQGQGLGTLLLHAVVIAADVHGADELYAMARADNEAIRGLVARIGGLFDPTGEGGVLEARWPVAEALSFVPHDDTTAALRALATEVLAPLADDHGGRH